MQSRRIQLGYPAGIPGVKAGTTIIVDNDNDTGLEDEPWREGGGDITNSTVKTTSQ